MEELIGGGGNLEVINLDEKEGTLRPLQAPDQIDAILLFERATGFANFTNQTYLKAEKILGGKEVKDSMILMLTDTKNSDEDNV